MLSDIEFGFFEIVSVGLRFRRQSNWRRRRLAVAAAGGGGVEETLKCV